jgi:diguanylate cyclase
MAERSGLMKLLTDDVLAQATADATVLGLGEREVDIAINVSMRNLRDPTFVNSVRQRLARSNLDPARLYLEITESVVMAEPDQTLVILRHFRDLGVRIAIDDFGTGYSSLSYLGRLPVDALKIDRSFVAGLLDDSASQSIVRATIDLAHALGLTVVAEGVETQEQLVRLRDLGCDRAQGFGIGRPMRAPDFAAWMNVHLAHFQHRQLDSPRATRGEGR